MVMRRSGRVILGAVLPLLAAVLFSCTPRPESTTTPDSSNPWDVAVADAPKPGKKLVAVGSEACTPCHAEIAERHRKTNHAATLYHATLAELKKLAPPDGEMRPGMRLRRDGDTLLVEAKHPVDGKLRQIPLALALGSGKTGLTFLVDEGDSSAEISRSYFPKPNAWHVTPGQETLDPKLIGVPHSDKETRLCLSCHAVTGPEQPMIPDRKFFGVGCESCHGPGSAHIDGAKISNLKGLSGEKVNALCGRCHRTAEDVKAMGAIAKDSTNRFQPYAMTLSKCFTKSAGKLSCITCHDPHENASTDQPRYEKTCLACHDGSARSKPRCPVNPTTKCVSCHMPTRSVFSGGSKLPIAMADHFIRSYKR
jgi:hypothetical protein